MSDEQARPLDLDDDDEGFQPWPSIDGVLATQEQVDELVAAVDRLRDAWKLADADRYRVYRERDDALAEQARLRAMLVRARDGLDNWDRVDLDRLIDDIDAVLGQEAPT